MANVWGVGRVKGGEKEKKQKRVLKRVVVFFSLLFSLKGEAGVYVGKRVGYRALSEEEREYNIGLSL